MFISRLRTHSQRGDTIVEVLISVAIVSLVLAASYAITSRNLAVSQDTQERSQALQVGQQQLEMMRVLSTSTPQVAVPVTAPLNCIKSSGGVPSAATLATDCKVDSSGTVNCTSQPCYGVGITDLGSNTYEVTVKWTNSHGAQAKLSLDYGI